jgi:hypothetical protein
LKLEIGCLKPEIGCLKLEIGSLKHEIGCLKPEVGSLKLEVGCLKPEVGSLKPEVGSLKPEVGSLKLEVGSLKLEMTGFNLESPGFKLEMALFKPDVPLIVRPDIQSTPAAPTTPTAEASLKRGLLSESSLHCVVMRPSPFRRGFAFAAALLFAGQVSVPAFDALLFHNNPEQSPASAHWDPPGGCQSHAEHCALSTTPGGPRLIAPAFRTITAVHELAHPLDFTGVTEDRSPARSPLQARAPPFVL